MDTTKQLTNDNMEYAINVKRIVDTSISQPKRVDGVTQYVTGDDNKKHVVNEWTTGLKYTLDFANCTLSDIVNMAVSSMVIRVASRNRKHGETVCNALDGTTLDVRDLITNKTSGLTGVIKYANKCVESGDAESMDQMIQMLIDQRATLKNKKS